VILVRPGCHDTSPRAQAGGAASPRAQANGQMQIALAGNPNVGKSTVFNSLTGLQVGTANYPGTTVDVTVAAARIDGHRLTIIDLPGTYALAGRTADQQAARRALLEERHDAVIAVLDATNLARNLYLVLQLLDLGFRIVVALNLTDEATRRGIQIDARRLGDLLGVPVVPTIATRRCGIAELMTEAVRLIGKPTEPRHRYGRVVEDMAAQVASSLNGSHAPARGHALLLLEEGAGGDWPPDTMTPAAIVAAAVVAQRATARSGEPVSQVIARERHLLADRIAREVTLKAGEVPGRRLWHLATRPVTGVPILLAVLGATFGVLFWGGSLLSRLIESVWTRVVSPAIAAPLLWAFGDGMVTHVLRWGLDAGLLAVFTIGIPYVLTFYLLLSALEDTGYLNVAAVLADRVFGRVGLNGRAAIPLVAGAGCSVPAILGLRVLRTERERLIGGTLVTMVPCSARTAVIMGAVAYMGGWRVALLLYAAVAVLIIGTGWGLNRLLPGRSPDLLMEIFPFRRPHLGTVLRKAWMRAREFVTVAIPIVLAGSIILGALYETGLIRLAARPLAPIVEGWLGLPAVAGLTLIFAVLRKELALQLLVALAIAQYGSGAANLASFMTPVQLFTYALVNTIYIPCVATMAVLGRAFGWRRAALISAFTITLALVAGGLVARLLALVGVV
jgi:ferrous iron transport protein B